MIKSQMLAQQTYCRIPAPVISVKVVTFSANISPRYHNRQLTSLPLLFTLVTDIILTYLFT